MYPVIIYCYDAYCGWCYGFSPVITKIEREYRNRIDFEILSGGMILPEKPKHISIMASYLDDEYKKVESLTGIRFGKDYLWHIENPNESDWFPTSEKPAIAMCVFKDYYPALAVQFAADLQYALHFEGRDLCDDEAYRHLLDKYDIPAEAFYQQLHAGTYKEKAYGEFDLCKKLQVNGFPAVFMQLSENKLYALANGYTDYTTLKLRIEHTVKEIARIHQQ